MSNVRGTPGWSIVNAANIINMTVPAAMKQPDPANAATNIKTAVAPVVIHGTMAVARNVLVKSAIFSILTILA